MTELRTLTGPATLAVADRLTATYRAVFGAPPWHESAGQAERFARLLADWATQPGFVAVLGTAGDRITGFALGVPTPAPFPEEPGYAPVRHLLGPAAESLCGWLEVAELAVLPSARRAGLGRRLLSTLVGDRPAWLLTVPGVAGTTEFYDAVGWRRHATGYGITVYTNRPLPTS